MPDPSPSTRVIGHGPRRIIISHGWIADSSLFDPVLDLVDQDRFTVAVVEHRGYGAAREVRPDGIAGSVRDVLAAADALSWSSFVLLGHSMGGLVAQQICATAPERLDAVVLLSAVPASGAQLPAPTRTQRALAVTSPAARRRLIGTNAACSSELADHIWRVSIDTVNDGAMLHFLGEFATADFADTLRGTPVPALVVTGADDPAVTTDLMRRTTLTFFPRNDLVELDGIGHYAMQQDPWRLLSTVIDGLDRLANRYGATAAARTHTDSEQTA